MLACVGIGVFTGFIFLVCLLLVAGDVDNVIENAAGPLLAIFFNATGSKAGSICLLMYEGVLWLACLSANLHLASHWCAFSLLQSRS